MRQAFILSTIAISAISTSQNSGWVTSSVTLDGNSTKTVSTGAPFSKPWIDFFPWGIPLGLPGFTFTIEKWRGAVNPTYGSRAILIGNCTVEFRWEPGIENKPKPTRALIGVSSNVTAHSNIGGTIAVANGLGASSTSVGGLFDIGESAYSRKVFLFEGQDPRYTLSGIHAAAMADTSTLPWGTSADLAEVDFSFSPLAYPKLLPAVDYLPNYRSEAGATAENQPDADGEYILDLAAYSIDYMGGQRWVGSIALTHSQSVYDSPFIKWLCSTPIEHTSPMYGVIQMGDTRDTFWQLLLSQGQSGSFETTTISVELNDRDDSSNPTIPSKIKIRWHMPYENEVRISGPTQLWNEGVVNEIEGTPVAVGNSCRLTWERPGGSAYTVRQLGDRFEKIADLGLPVASIIAGWLGGGIDLFAPTPRVAFVPNDALTSGPVWSHPDSSFSPNDTKPRERYMMTNPKPFYESYRSIWNAEKYDTLHGYLGHELVAGEKTSGLESFAGYFWYVAPGDDGGFPGGEGK